MPKRRGRKQSCSGPINFGCPETRDVRLDGRIFVSRRRVSSWSALPSAFPDSQLWGGRVVTSNWCEVHRSEDKTVRLACSGNEVIRLTNLETFLSLGNNDPQDFGAELSVLIWRAMSSSGLLINCSENAFREGKGREWPL